MESSHTIRPCSSTPQWAVIIKLPHELVQAFNDGEDGEDPDVTITLGEAKKHILQFGENTYQIQETTDKNCDCYRWDDNELEKVGTIMGKLDTKKSGRSNDLSEALRAVNHVEVEELKKRGIGDLTQQKKVTSRKIAKKRSAPGTAGDSKRRKVPVGPAQRPGASRPAPTMEASQSGGPTNRERLIHMLAAAPKSSMSVKQIKEHRLKPRELQEASLMAIVSQVADFINGGKYCLKPGLWKEARDDMAFLSSEEAAKIKANKALLVDGKVTAASPPGKEPASKKDEVSPQRGGKHKINLKTKDKGGDTGDGTIRTPEEYHEKTKKFKDMYDKYTELDRTLNKNKQHIKKLGEEYSLIEDKNEKAMKKAEIDKVYTQLAPEVEKDLKRFNQLHKDVGDLKARIKAYERSA